MKSRSKVAPDAHPVTPDGRYFVVRGRLWRRTDPKLPEAERERLTHDLMAARRAIANLKRNGDGDLAGARAAVDRAKIELGERGPVWWDDGAPDYNRRMASNTPYRDWYATLASVVTEKARRKPSFIVPATSTENEDL